jgi:homoserine kinase
MKSRSIEVRIPASTANLGSGFDCCALALQLHLTVRATVLPYTEPTCRVESTGPSPDCFEGLAQDQTNLIYQTMKFVAEQEGFSLPPVHLAVVNEIPLASGLGSSGAAIVAGLKLASAISGREISNDLLLRYATKIEGHAITWQRPYWAVG